MQDKDAQILTLKDALTKAERERDEAMYSRDVAEWAVVGIADANILVSVLGTIIGTPSYIASIGQKAGRTLLHEAGLAFDSYAELYELRSHVHYLENLMRSNAVPFDPHKEKGPSVLPCNRFRPSWGYSYNGFKDVRR